MILAKDVARLLGICAFGASVGCTIRTLMGDPSGRFFALCCIAASLFFLYAEAILDQEPGGPS